MIRHPEKIKRNNPTEIKKPNWEWGHYLLKYEKSKTWKKKGAEAANAILSVLSQK